MKKLFALVFVIMIAAFVVLGSASSFADPPAGLTLPSSIVVPPTRQDIKHENMIGNYRLKQDGVLDLYLDDYTICCFYDEGNTFSGLNVLWPQDSGDADVFYCAYGPDENLTNIFVYWGYFGDYRYTFDMDGNVTEVVYNQNGTDYHWIPQTNDGWYYEYLDQNNNWQRTYPDGINGKKRTDLIPPATISFTNDTYVFWTASPPVISSLQELEDEIAAHNKALQSNPAAEATFYTAGDFTINEPLQIPKGFTLIAQNTLTIGAKGNVTINGNLRVGYGGMIRVESGGTMESKNEIHLFDGGVIDVFGTYRNNGRKGVHFWLQDPEAPTPQLIIENGATYVAGSGFAFDAPVTPQVAVQNINMDNYCHHIDHNIPNRMSYYPADIMTFELMFPVGGQHIDYLEVHGRNTLTLRDNVEIPAFDDGTVSRVVMSDTTLVVPNGKTMTVYGELIVKELVVEQGGSFVLQDGGTLIETKTESSEITALRAAIKNGQAGYTLQSNAPIILAKDLIIPRNFTLTVGTTLQVMPGTVLTLEGDSSNLVITDEGELDVAGTVISSGVIDLSASGVICISGVFQGNPGSRISVERAYMSDIIPRVIIEQSGQFNGMGGVMISQSILNVVDCSAIIYGADLSQWCDAVDKYNGPGYFPGKDIVPEIFAGMCESGRFSQIRLRGTGNLSLTDNLTIPEGVYLKVRNGSTLTVPAGKTLTINGKIEASYNGRIDVLGTLQNNGEIEMFDGGVIDVSGTYNHAGGKAILFTKDGNLATPKLIIEQGASCTLNLFRTDEGLTAEDVIEGFDVSAYSYHRNYDRDKHVIKDRRVYYPSSRAGIEDMENRAIGYIEIRGLDTYTLNTNKTDVNIPVFDGTTLATVDMSNTTLVVPNGVTVTVNGELTVKALEIQGNGCVNVAQTGTLTVNNSLTVAGMLLNRNKIVLGANANVVMLQKSIYSGLGTVTRGGQPYAIWNRKDSADLILPENLTSIESEAFANGRYGSAYIPAGVKSIADDAFGDKRRMTIYGEPGTTATQFAIDKGFLFAPVEPSNPAA